MNKILLITGAAALVGGAVLGATFIGSNPNNTAPDTTLGLGPGRLMSEQPLATDYLSMRPAISDLPAESLSQTEIDGLLLMREEEKLARDVYQTLYEKWGLQIFANIAQSEQTHTEAVRDLLVKYDVVDPVSDDMIGVFTNADLAALYADLVEKGNASEVAALTVGATIEDLDIKDLMDLSADTDNEDILMVYENLTRGSRNHLRAFTRQLTMRDERYEPQYITNELYQEIINSEQETGRNNGRGGHGGRGWGGGKGGGNR